MALAPAASFRGPGRGRPNGVRRTPSSANMSVRRRRLRRRPHAAACWRPSARGYGTMTGFFAPYNRNGDPALGLYGTIAPHPPVSNQVLLRAPMTAGGEPAPPSRRGRGTGPGRSCLLAAKWRRSPESGYGGCRSDESRPPGPRGSVPGHGGTSISRQERLVFGGGGSRPPALNRPGFPPERQGPADADDPGEAFPSLRIPRPPGRRGPAKAGPARKSHPPSRLAGFRGGART